MARKSSEQARAEVRAAAKEVLAERGVGGFSVDAVVERSGVAKTTIYRYWSSAHHLLVDTAALDLGPVSTPNTGNLRDDLVAIMSSMANLVEQDGMRSRALDLLAASGRDPLLEAARDEMLETHLQPLHTVLEIAQLRGEIDPSIDLGLVADLIQGAMFYRRILRGDPLSPERIAQMVDTLQAGIAPD